MRVPVGFRCLLLLWSHNVVQGSLSCLPCIDRTQVKITAVVHGTQSQAFWAQVQRAAQTAAMHMKVILNFDLEQLFSSQNMAASVRAAAAAQPHAMLVSIPTDEVAAAVRDITVNTSIPVFSLNAGYQQANSLGVKAHVSMDEVAAGTTVGAEFATAFAAKGVNVTGCLSINTDINDLAQAQRAKGFGDWCNSSGVPATTVQVNGENLVAMAVVLEQRFAAMAAAGQLRGLAVLCLDERAVVTAVAKLKAAAGGSLGTNAVGSFGVGPDVYGAIAAGDLLFGVEQGAWLQGFLPVVLATIYVTTGQIMPVPLYPTGPKVVRTVPTSTAQACAANAFPTCSCPWASGAESSVATSQCITPPPIAPSAAGAVCPCRDARKLKIVGVTHGVQSAGFWQIVRGGAEQAAMDFRLEDFVMDFQTQGNPDEQARRILAAAADPSVDGIFVSLPGVYGDAVANATAEAAKSKYIVTMNSGSGYAYRLDSGRRILAHVSQDEVLAGWQAGELLFRKGAKKLFCVIREYGNSGLDNRCQGLVNFVNAAGQGSVTVLQMGIDIDTSNKDNIVAYLKNKIAAHPDVEGMLLADGLQVVASAVLAMRATRSLVAGSFDPGPDLVAAVTAGQMHFGIDQLPWMQGYMSVLFLVMKVLSGEQIGVPANKMLPTGPFLVQSFDPVTLQCQAAPWDAATVGAPFAQSYTVGFPPCEFNPPCAPGRIKTPSGSCVACEAGTASPGGLATECTRCAPGTATGVPTGAASCVPCAPGTYASAAKRTSCTACEAGRFVAENSTTGCANCAVGAFADRLGTTACTSCSDGHLRPWLYSTMQSLEVNGADVWVPLAGAVSHAQCGCSAGAYVEEGECTPCGEGMVCGGMGDVLLEKGYFASTTRPGFVYRCFGCSSARCPGGAPGVCALGRLNTSLACSDCEANMYGTDRGPCQPCGRSGALPFAALAIALFIGLCGVYWFIESSDRAARNQSILVAGLAFSQLVTLLQQLGVFGTIALNWPNPFKEVLAVVELINFNPEILNVDCVQTMTPPAKFFGRIFVVIVLFVALVFIHFVYVLVRYNGAFRARMLVLADATGTLFLAFFISVVSSMLAPFQCNQHPNGIWTVRKYPSVVCWENSHGDYHAAMIGISVAAMTIPATFLAVTAYAVWKYPSAMASGRVEFFHSFSFLFFRFRPGAHWYVLVSLLRNTGITIVATIGRATVQIVLLEALLLPSLWLIAHFLPWAVKMASYMEAATTLMLALVIVCFALFVEDTDGEAVAKTCCALVAAPVAGMLFLLCEGVYARFMRRGKDFQYFLCHHKAGAGNFARLLKTSLLESAAVHRRVFLDSDYLLDLDELFGIVGSNTDNLVVICSREILTRPWCMGEVATAMLHKVTTVKALLPDFSWPEPEFSRLYDEKVPQASMLAQYSISVELLKEALQWLEEKPSISLPAEIMQSSMVSLVGSLLDCHKLKPKVCLLIGATSSKDTNPSQQLRVSLSKNVILAETTCCEMACTAIVLQKLLAPFFVQEGLPWVLPSDSLLPETTEQVCLICNNGVFNSPHVVGNVLRAAEGSMGVLPIVTETSFRFPTKEFYEQLRVSGHAMLSRMGSPHSSATLVMVVDQLFREIAVELNLQEAESILQARAQAIANRLQRGNKIRKLRFTADGVPGRSQQHLQQIDPEDFQVNDIVEGEPKWL